MRFNQTRDNVNGLRITINDTWGNHIELVEVSRVGQFLNMSIRVTIYDHFGLDRDDTRFVEGLRGTIIGGDEFAAWYVLQHYRGTNNRHRPFIAYFERVFSMSVRL